MLHRRRFARVGAFAPTSLLSVGLFLACSDDEPATSTAAKPEGPPALAILDVTAEDGVRHSSFEEPINIGCSKTLVVRVGPNPSPGKLENFTLRPAHACGATVQCGYVGLSASSEAQTKIETFGAQTNLVLDFADSAPESAFAPGDYELVAELLNDDGTRFELEEETFSDRVTVSLVEDCEAGSSGGAGGADGSGGAPPGSGGTGGAAPEMGGNGGGGELGGSGGVPANGGGTGGESGPGGGSGGAGGAN